MENSNSVNLYVYTTVDLDGNETYSYPFSAIDDDSAIRMIAHTLAFSLFYQNVTFILGHVFHLGSLEYVSSFTVSRPSPNDLCLAVDHNEVFFNSDVYQRDFDYFFSALSNSSQIKEDKPNA